MPDKEINGTLSRRCRLFSRSASMSGQSKNSVMVRNIALAARLTRLPHLSVFAMLYTVFLPDADAAIFTNINQYENSKALAANPIYRRAAAVQRTTSSGTTYSSAIMIAPDFFITAGHVVPLSGTVNEIIFLERTTIQAMIAIRFQVLKDIQDTFLAILPRLISEWAGRRNL